MRVMLQSIPVRVQLVRWESIRTDRTGLHPGVKECARLRLRAGRGLAVSSRSPGPADQRILAHVMDDVFEGAAAVAGRIFDLLDKSAPASCPPNPSHAAPGASLDCPALQRVRNWPFGGRFGNAS